MHPLDVPGHGDEAPLAADAGGYVVRDANGQALVYVYSRESEAEALQAKVLYRSNRCRTRPRGELNSFTSKVPSLSRSAALKLF